MTVLGALPILAVLLLFTGSAEAWIRLPATTLATLPPEAHNPEGTTAGCSAGSRCLAAAISSSAWRDNLWIAANQTDEIVVLNPTGKVIEWAAQVRRHTIVKIPARIPPVPGPKR